MNLENCYHEFGEDFEKVRARLLSEARIRKLILLFLRDPSFTQLQAAMTAGCLDEAKRAAHTMKGTALNLGFNRLSESAVQILAALREDNMTEAAMLLPSMEKEYEATISAIRRYESLSGA